MLCNEFNHLFLCFASYTCDLRVVLVNQLNKALPKQKLLCKASVKGSMQHSISNFCRE